MVMGSGFRGFRVSLRFKGLGLRVLGIRNLQGWSLCVLGGSWVVI